MDTIAAGRADDLVLARHCLAIWNSCIEQSRAAANDGGFPATINGQIAANARASSVIIMDALKKSGAAETWSGK